MNKKHLKLIAALSIGMIVLPIQVVAFFDVSANNPYKQAIFTLRDMGVVQGYTDGNYGVEDNLSRTEALKIVVRTFAADDFDAFIVPESLEYEDVNTDNWFHSYVAYAKDKKIATGFNANSFKPLEKITMAESLKLLHVLSKGIELETPEGDDWYLPYQNWAIDNGLLLSDQEGELGTLDHLTRGDFADIVYRAYASRGDLKNEPELKSEVQEALSYNWPDTFLGDITFLTPYFWEQQELTDGFSTFIRDPHYSQVFIPTVYPLSASMTVESFPKSEQKNSVIAASLKQELIDLYGTKSQIIEANELEAEMPRVIYKVPEIGRMDAYYFLDDAVYVFHGRYGVGEKEEQFQLMLSTIINSVEHNESGVTFTAASTTPNITTTKTSDIAERSSLARKNILLPEKAEFTLNYFPDILLIETDSIGIGTGPVDYYYSTEADFTLKIERDSDVILDILPSRTTAF